VVFDEKEFPFAAHPSAVGAQYTSEILLLPEPSNGNKISTNIDTSPTCLPLPVFGSCVQQQGFGAIPSAADLVLCSAGPAPRQAVADPPPQHHVSPSSTIQAVPVPAHLALDGPPNNVMEAPIPCMAPDVQPAVAEPAIRCRPACDVQYVPGQESAPASTAAVTAPSVTTDAAPAPSHVSNNPASTGDASPDSAPVVAWMELCGGQLGPWPSAFW
jgi:hypothetical protein